MPTITVPEADRPANVRSTTASGTYNGRAESATCTLVSSEWTAKAGTGTFVWGAEISTDGGATWTKFSGSDDPEQIGVRTRSGGMPVFGVGSDTGITPPTGAQFRLYFVPSVAIRLGATIDLSP